MIKKALFGSYEVVGELYDKTEEVSRMIQGFMNYLKTP